MCIRDRDTITGRKIKMIIVNLEKSSEQINKTITNLKEGKGALNYLSNDPKLVKQIDSTTVSYTHLDVYKRQDYYHGQKHERYS